MTALRPALRWPAAAASTAPVVSRWPRHDADEIDAVTAVLRSGRTNALAHGDCNRAFEQAFAAVCEAPFGIAMANGTLALEVALRALGIGHGDEVIVTPRSFFASAGCIVTCGATPVFADVDPVTQNLNAETIARVMTGRTRAIVAVHLAGWPCPMGEIMALADGHGLMVIEDCAQAHGATIDGRPVGAFGHAAAYSFCTDKIMSTGGEGGMLLMRDPEVFQRAWSLKDHGKSLIKVRQPASGKSFRPQHDSFGSNYRLTEMQAAIGLVQLGKLPTWLEARRQRAATLNAMFRSVAGLRLTIPDETIGHSYYKYYAFVRPERLRSGWSRERIIAQVNELGMPCFSGSCPEIYAEAAFTAARLAPPQRLATAHMLGATSLMLPVDPTLTLDDMARIGNAVRDVMREATA